MEIVSRGNCDQLIVNTSTIQPIEHTYIHEPEITQCGLYFVEEFHFKSNCNTIASRPARHLEFK